jgi:hypothetical protein
VDHEKEKKGKLLEERIRVEALMHAKLGPYMFMCVHITWICTYVHMFIYIYICTIRMYVYKHTYVCVCVCVCLWNVCIYLLIKYIDVTFVCMYAFVCMCVYEYI